MAAAKQKAPKKAPKTPVVEGPFDADGELDEDGNIARATFDPTTHGVYAHSIVESLTSAREADSKAEAKAVTADAERLQVIFTGLGESQSADRDEIKRLRLKLDSKAEALDTYRNDLAAMDRENATLIKGGEEASLERERLKHDIEAKELAIQHLHTSKSYDLAVRERELGTLKEMGMPAAMAVAGGLERLMATGSFAGTPAPGKVGGLPAASQPASPNGQAHPVNGHSHANGQANGANGVTYAPATVSLEETEAWSEAFMNVYRRLGPIGLAHMRAAFCSLLPNTPTFPKSTREVLIVLYSEAGEEPLKQLAHLTSHAYRPEPPPAQTDTPVS